MASSNNNAFAPSSTTPIDLRDDSIANASDKNFTPSAEISGNNPFASSRAVIANDAHGFFPHSLATSGDETHSRATMSLCSGVNEPERSKICCHNDCRATASNSASSSRLSRAKLTHVIGSQYAGNACNAAARYWAYFETSICDDTVDLSSLYVISHAANAIHSVHASASAAS